MSVLLSSHSAKISNDDYGQDWKCLQQLAKEVQTNKTIANWKKKKKSFARLAKARQVHEHIPNIYSGPVFLGLRKKLSENIQQRTNRWTEITPPYAEPYSLIVWVIQELFYLCRATEEACSSILYRLWLLLLRTSQRTGEKSGIKKKILALIQGWISSSPFPALQSQVSSNLHLFARGGTHIPPNWYLANYISLIKDPIFNSIWIYLPVSTEFLCNLNQIISTQKFCNQGRWKIRPRDGNFCLDRFKCVPFLEWMEWIWFI